MPAKRQTGIVPRSLDQKAHRVQFQINRIKASIELPGVTAIRLLNEDVRRSIAACVWVCKWVEVSDLRTRVLNHSNKSEN